MSSTEKTGKRLKYYFDEILYCEMCGDKTDHHTVLGQRLNTSQGLSPKKKTGISVSVQKCTKCNLIYSQPQPIPFDIQDHYGTPPEEYWTKAFFEWEHYFEAEVKIFKELVPFKEGMKALDVGAGIGRCMVVLTKAGFDAYGFEPSLPFYERALSTNNIDPSRLQNGMIENIDYPENSFDFITFGAVLEHLYHPNFCMEKAFKWLKSNGIMHIEVPSSRHLIGKIINLYYRLRGTNYVTNISPMHTPFHLYEFDIKSFEAVSDKFGFEIAKQIYYVCGIDYVPKILQPVFRKYMEMTNTGLQLSVYLRKK